jgi:hypothetical protein
MTPHKKIGSLQETIKEREINHDSEKDLRIVTVIINKLEKIKKTLQLKDGGYKTYE